MTTQHLVAWADGRRTSTGTCSCSAPTSPVPAHPCRHHGRAGLSAPRRVRRRRPALRRDLKNLDQCMADHGFPSAVVEVVEPASAAGLGRARGVPQHHDVHERRRQAGLLHRGLCGASGAPGGLHRCTELFSRYGTRGTWYAHASVGCLHVRPILNLKDDGDIRSMRAIAEATCDLVKRFEARTR